MPYSAIALVTRRRTWIDESSSARSNAARTSGLPICCSSTQARSLVLLRPGDWRGRRGVPAGAPRPVPRAAGHSRPTRALPDSARACRYRIPHLPHPCRSRRSSRNAHLCCRTGSAGANAPEDFRRTACCEPSCESPCQRSIARRAASRTDIKVTARALAQGLPLPPAAGLQHPRVDRGRCAGQTPPDSAQLLSGSWPAPAAAAAPLPGRRHRAAYSRSPGALWHRSTSSRSGRQRRRPSLSRKFRSALPFGGAERLGLQQRGNALGITQVRVEHGGPGLGKQCRPVDHQDLLAHGMGNAFSETLRLGRPLDRHRRRDTLVPGASLAVVQRRLATHLRRDRDHPASTKAARDVRSRSGRVRVSP